MSFALDIVFEKHVLAVKDGIRVLGYPIAQDQDTAAAREHEIQFDVAMSEDEVVDLWMLLEIILGKLDEKFLILAHIGRITSLLAMLQPAMLGPIQSKRHGPTGMNAREEGLTKFTAEETAHESEFGIRITQSISMPEVEEFVGNLNGDGVMMNFHAAFLLEVILAPDVMITREEMNLDAHIRQLTDLAQKTCIALWYHIAEFIPEVKDVPQQVDCRSLVLDLIKETYQTTLLLSGMWDGKTTEVGITEEIDVLHK